MPKGKSADFETWAKIAATEVTSTENPLPIPYDIAEREAIGMAGFVEKYWDPVTAPGHERPGLKRVQKRLKRAIAEELLQLVRAVQDAQTSYLLQADPAVLDHGERAREVIDELEAALHFLLDDGTTEPADQKLQQIERAHSQDGQRSSALSQTLRDFARLAESLKDRLLELDTDFDPAIIAEARALADGLTRGAAEAASKTETAESKQAVAIRNRLLTLRQQRVSQVREAARYVFRKHPEILREATSAYERRVRAERRRQALKAPGSTPA